MTDKVASSFTYSIDGGWGTDGRVYIRMNVGPISTVVSGVLHMTESTANWVPLSPVDPYFVVALLDMPKRECDDEFGGNTYVLFYKNSIEFRRPNGDWNPRNGPIMFADTGVTTMPIPNECVDDVNTFKVMIASLRENHAKYLQTVCEDVDEEDTDEEDTDHAE